MEFMGKEITVEEEKVLLSKFSNLYTNWVSASNVDSEEDVNVLCYFLNFIFWCLQGDTFTGVSLSDCPLRPYNHFLNFSFLTTGKHWRWCCPFCGEEFED